MMKTMKKPQWITFASRALLGITLLMVVSLYVIVMLTPKEEQSVVPFKRVEQEVQPDVKPNPKLVQVKDTESLTDLFSAVNYSLEKDHTGQVQVPHVYLAKLPKDFRNASAAAGSPASKQELFIQSLLPLILNVNHAIKQEREYIVKLHNIQEAGQPLTHEQNIWLDKVYVKYRLKERDMHLLLKRVDEIPVSLALAQGIQECGWGSSSAARNKNSTHGVTLSSGVKAYDTLYHSVYSYMLNLNANPAYSAMRQIRHEMRTSGKDLCSEKLTDGLHRYSELGNRYVRKIQSIIRAYDLKQYDQAKFQSL